MRSKRRLILGALLMAFGGLVGSIVLGVSFLPFSGQAADHGDSPQVKVDLAADITDVYAFRSPANANNLVAVLNVNPYAPGDPPDDLFSDKVRYQLHVDKDGALATDEATVTVTFSGDPQRFKVEGLTSTPLEGDVTPIGDSSPNILTQGDVKVFCGPRDDPFFFDLTGFKNFLASPFVPISGNGLRPSGQTPSDTFAGANVASIVLEFPITAVTGAPSSNTGTIKVWASTAKASSTGGSATRIVSPLNP
jgi:hypothetical protein